MPLVLDRKAVAPRPLDARVNGSDDAGTSAELLGDGSPRGRGAGHSVDERPPRRVPSTNWLLRSGQTVLSSDAGRFLSGVVQDEWRSDGAGSDRKSKGVDAVL